jgi:predicted small lipoprotein YifL
LGGCGRKGALDPPPSASLANDQQVNMPPSLGEQNRPFAGPPPSATPSGGTPPAAASSAASGSQPPANRTFILDWLLK